MPTMPKKINFPELFSEAEGSNSLPDNIFYKQRVTVDRAEIITTVKPRHESMEDLAENKTQSLFLKERKMNLNEYKCLVLADFAENYSFVIQDKIHCTHWTKCQATLHPFIYYYRKGEKIEQKSFFASAHGKNACDGVGGTTPRYSINNQATRLDQRVENCKRVTGIRSFLRFVTVNESTIRLSRQQKHSLDVDISDTVACIYDGQWLLTEVDDISIENKDVHVIFYHPTRPSTSLKKTVKDSTQVPLNRILRKLTPRELTTTTERSHNISNILSDEISVLLNSNSG
ncbi:hypothetical protein PR048_004422 [Dryococelus australis]|uniref:Uncharacterized protein n=1 Tax=Dryococelus australis TaxID=614101 RepID=A0ABQ9I5E8_9NEOP|nr:hypothetical protein PR048_004422 [Dryococelus australis]